MKIWVVAEPATIWDEFDSSAAAIYGVFDDEGNADALAEQERASVYEYELNAPRTERL